MSGKSDSGSHADFGSADGDRTANAAQRRRERGDYAANLRNVLTGGWVSILLGDSTAVVKTKTESLIGADDNAFDRRAGSDDISQVADSDRTG